jgi:hypothetical protein
VYQPRIAAGTPDRARPSVARLARARAPLQAYLSPIAGVLMFPGRASFPLRPPLLLCLLAAALPGLGCTRNEAVTTGAPQSQTEFPVVADWPRLPAGYVLGQGGVR